MDYTAFVGQQFVVVSMRERRGVLIALCGALAVLPFSALAETRLIPAIGYLGFGTAAASANRIEAMRTGLRELGYIEGRTVAIEFRWAETSAQLREFAAELVRMKLDVIFATSSTEASAARQATKTIPIVFATHADPVAIGHIESLARPGGNMTGISIIQSDLTIKALEILREAVPRMSRIGVLWSPTAPSGRTTVEAAKAAAVLLGVKLHFESLQSADDFGSAFVSMGREGVQGIFVAASALARAERKLLADLALKHKLPSIFGARENVEAGGLMSYSANLVGLTRDAATYIHKILKGAKPAELPVEQASKYQLIINLKTAYALNTTIPESLVVRADEIIE